MQAICLHKPGAGLIDVAGAQRMASAVARKLMGAAPHLNELDRCIGDGDHGSNMERGCRAILESIVPCESCSDVFNASGTALIMSVGGASGPLYGTLLRSIASNLPSDAGYDQFVQAFGQAVNDVACRGRSARGQKSMLDTLYAVHEYLCKTSEEKFSASGMAAAATQAALQTIPMKATCGRASYLGERSIGHLDAGAWSSALMVHAICDALSEDTSHE